MADTKLKVDAAVEREYANEFISFLNSSKSNYAAVASAKTLLKAQGYVYLSEGDSWAGKIKAGGKYFTTRNQTSIIAFAVGKKYSAVENGFNITAAHTDSPCLRVKPISKITASSYLQVGLECYGGGLWNTWFDRDLGLSGRVLVSEGDKVVGKLVNIDKPLLRIPNLAIHLNRSVNDDGFKFNKEEQLVPILASSIKDALETPTAQSDSSKEHHAVLLSLLAKELAITPEQIQGFDLSLTDVQPATLGGAHSEFVFSGRLDNLMMSWTCLKSLIGATTDALLENETQVQMAVLFDNEEIGSETAHGAGSTLLPEIVTRVAEAMLAPGQKHALAQTWRRSFLFSCDMAHGVHPNYRGKHESNHSPLIHHGPVIKENCNARYATTVETKYITKALAAKANVPTQAFVVRNDSLCGSTIGPILAAKLGLRCVDIGIPQFAMHSIRETAGTADLVHSVNLLRSFHLNFAALDKTIVTDDLE